jgi:hypothetical protein
METKFRGLTLDGKQFVYGDLIHYGDRCFIFDESIPMLCTQGLSANKVLEIASNEIRETSYEVVSETVGQWTGEKAGEDDNGEDIYLGDLIRDEKGHIGKVVFFNAIYWLRYDRGVRELTLVYDRKIVGNIHQKQENQK